MRARTVGLLAGLGAVAGVLARRRRRGGRHAGSEPEAPPAREPSDRRLQGTASPAAEVESSLDEVPDGWSVVEFEESRGTEEP